MKTGTLTYDEAGVDTARAELCIKKLKGWVEDTFSFSSHARVCLPLGYFANVLDIGGGIGIAISTDGVGTKIMVAEKLRRLDTVGIDCIAMNVNDVLCVGARPISMVDYIAVQRISPEFLEDIGRGLREGARLAGISIPGGEIAQVPEMLRGVEEGSGFDLVGTCVGIVPTGRIITGDSVAAGDVVIGLPSSGIHSNGFTLAREALLRRGRMDLTDRVQSLGRTLGEELLEPTRIYVKEVLRVLDEGIEPKALVHITGDGFMNLARVVAEVGFELDAVPPPLPIFSLIQEQGQVATEEMYTVCNMGIGFCIVVSPSDTDRTLEILNECDCSPQVLGKAVRDSEKAVRLVKQGIVGVGNRFRKD